MTEVINYLFDAYATYSAFEIILESLAFGFGIISVIYAKRENILVYPTGITCTLITMYFMYNERLIGHMMVNLFYTLMSIYGWWNWSRKNDDKYLLKITRFSKGDFGITITLFLITVVITYTVYILSSVVIKIPNYIDIFTSGIFFTAMWLMANKKLESWVLWIIGDIITVPLYAYRGLGMLSLQYIIFTFLAIQGYIEWKKSLSK